MGVIIFKVLILGIITFVFWQLYQDAITKQQQRKEIRKVTIPRDTTPIKREARIQHNTKSLASILDNKKNPQVKIRGFDNELYAQIMAEYEVSDTYQTYQ